jgi:adenosyl cobinamide kinase/adenosyl cobinamide phosphate guanylyltransferase
MILILGGARSGKSTFAEQLAKQSAREKILFIATAEPLDDEMRERIAKHRAARPAAWQTLEAPRDLPSALAQLEKSPQLILLDCMTLWVTNEMLASEADVEKRLLGQLDMLIEWTRLHDIDLIIVSNEVGLGIVPENALARRFRDVLGIVNAHAAQNADKVYWMVAGLPLEVKSISRAPFEKESG